MKIKLLYHVENLIDVIYLACKTCYSKRSPIEIEENLKNNILSNEDKLKLINQVWSSAHLSTAEHVYFTFAIEGVSRSLLAQLSRHRFVSLSVQSQRYVDMSDCKFAIPYNLNEIQFEQIDFILDKTKTSYKELLKLGLKKEDARSILPNAASTNLIMSCNLRELMHLCNLRMCVRAQSEIRRLFNGISEIVTDFHPWLAFYLVPKCEKFGFCQEHNSCGKKPKLEKIIEVYNANKK